MAAVFPNGTKQFKIHRNLLDDVTAEDINSIQDEVVAIQNVLGEALLDIEELESDVEEIEEVNERQDETLKVYRQRFKNMKERLDYLQAGRNIYVGRLYKQTFLIPTQNVGTTRPATIDFPKPDAEFDPNKLFNGTGLTLKVRGWWLIMGHVRYDLAFGGVGGNDALYQAAIGVNAEERSYDRYRGVENQHDITLNPHLISHFPRGTKINLRTSHNSSAPNRRVSYAWLGAFGLRRI